MTQLDELLSSIANEHLDVPTLETRHSDSLDFHNIAVWQFAVALRAAYDAGMQSSADESDSDIDVHDLLAERRQIAVIWSIEDVQEIRPDLDDDQAWEVLQYCDKAHDSSIGLNWDSIEIVADDLFPSKTED